MLRPDYACVGVESLRFRVCDARENLRLLIEPRANTEPKPLHRVAAAISRPRTGSGCGGSNVRTPPLDTQAEPDVRSSLQSALKNHGSRANWATLRRTPRIQHSANTRIAC